MDLLSLVESMGGGAAAWAICALVARRHRPKRFEPEPQPDPPSHPYLYGWVANKQVDRRIERVYGWRCPVCAKSFVSEKDINMQGAICDCLEFPRLHFHWKCRACRYTAIMRTANDREK